VRLPIYLDYNATTPVDPVVMAAMFPLLTERFGNPSSSHLYGQEAHASVETARRQVAALLGCEPAELIFTGCGSESNNLAIKGAVLANLDRGRHMITCAVEHPAVLQVCRFLERYFHCTLTVLPVDSFGRVDPDEVRRAIRPDTVLITVMHAQNEVGTLQPIAEIGALAREHGVLFHVDAAQSVGKIPVRVADLGCDLLTVAGHKLYAPKGVGALYVRRGVRLEPLIHGAGHEGGLRAGTENAAYIAGLGAACALAAPALATESDRQRLLRDRLHHLLAEAAPEAVLNGHREHRLPNTLNLSFPGQVGPLLLERAPEVAASTGAACHSGENRPSAILKAMGATDAVALGALRLSVGRYTDEEQVEAAAFYIARALRG
jgi:cysteine desulfurase